MTAFFARRSGRISIVPGRIDRVLAGASVVLLVVIAAALVRGRTQWGHASAVIWLHLATIMVALALTPLMLLRRRGDRLHRRLGYLWVASLTLTAALSFAIRTINPGGFSLIHVLSAFTLVQTPLIAWYARTGRIAAHLTTVRLMVAGALLIAGFFTFPFGRMLGRWLMA